MKKKLLVLSVIGLVSFTVILLRENIMLKGKINIGTDNVEKGKRKDMLSMMLETEAGSGKYEMVTRDSWPTEGYTFNSILSKCENGGELSWDDENKRVLMSGNVSDKCYVYFDIKKNSFLLSTTSTRETTSLVHGALTLAGIDISNKIGETIEYKIGDVLIYKTLSTFSYGQGIKIYDGNNVLIKNLSQMSCESTQYIMTGKETLIESYTEGHPEVSDSCDDE